MDKTLEIVMVAVALVVAAVIVVSLLQGRIDMFGGFSDNQTSDASCGISKTQFCNAADTSSGSINSDRADEIHSKNNPQCAWTSSSDPSSICD